MISSEVQRTLVKSPPELWAELSDPASLARHLGELGEIRITRVEPEKTVEWEAADTTGKVLLKASGWGTKVTLTVTREAAETVSPVESELAGVEGPANGEGPAAGEAQEPAAEQEPAVEELEEPAAAAEPLGGPAGEAELTVEEVEEPGSGAVAEQPERRQGFFARIFRRRRPEQVLSEPQEVEPELTVEPEPAPAEETSPQDAPPQEHPDIAAELQAAEEITAQEVAAEEVAAEEVTAVLTAVLDRLGAAHHRPFSRT